MSGILLFLALNTLSLAEPQAQRWIALELASAQPVEFEAAPEETPAELARRQVIEAALALLGRPYRLGGRDPRTGIDCSGLVRLAYQPLQLELPYSARTQISVGSSVQLDSIGPGDLLFFRNTNRRGISHVGLYLGEGRFIHASNGRRGVTISSIEDPYYRKHFAGARRLLDEAPAEFASHLLEGGELLGSAPVPVASGDPGAGGR